MICRLMSNELELVSNLTIYKSKQSKQITFYLRWKQLDFSLENIYDVGNNGETLSCVGVCSKCNVWFLVLSLPQVLWNVCGIRKETGRTRRYSDIRKKTAY